MTDTSHVPLAVVGIGCRFPGDATNPDKLWDLLASGKSAWSRVPADRWNEEAFLHPNPDDTNGSYNHVGGHFLEQDVSEFDAGFFNVLPGEAASMVRDSISKPVHCANINPSRTLNNGFYWRPPMKHWKVLAFLRKISKDQTRPSTWRYLPEITIEMSIRI